MKLAIRPDAAVFVLTGAGISAESGISTFRDAGGVWERHDLRQVATPEGFRANPALVWRFYSERRRQGEKCTPNAGHSALGGLERYLEGRGRFTLATQNVDGLHQRAGSRDVLTLHGSLYRSRCSNERCPRKEGFEDHGLYPDGPPHCDACGALLRPDIVWFGEYLDPGIEQRARTAAAESDVFIAVGTSGAVYPAAGYAAIAAMGGSRTILVNLDPPENIYIFGEFHRGKAGEILPGLLAP